MNHLRVFRLSSQSRVACSREILLYHRSVNIRSDETQSAAQLPGKHCKHCALNDLECLTNRLLFLSDEKNTCWSVRVRTKRLAARGVPDIAGQLGQGVAREDWSCVRTLCNAMQNVIACTPRNQPYVRLLAFLVAADAAATAKVPG